MATLLSTSNEDTNSFGAIYNDDSAPSPNIVGWAEKFTVPSGWTLTVTSVLFNFGFVANYGSHEGVWTARIYDNSSGPDTVQATSTNSFTIDSSGDSAQDRTFNFSSIELTAGTYYIALELDSWSWTSDPSNAYTVCYVSQQTANENLGSDYVTLEQVGDEWRESTITGWYDQTAGRAVYFVMSGTADSGLSKPTNPTPSDGSGPGIDFSGYQLSWDDGGGAIAYDVYIGTSGDLTQVSNGQGGTTYTTSASELETIFGTSPIDQTVYWRVDATDGNDTVTGDVWSFDPRPTKASNPNPADAETGVNLSSGFSWDAGSAVDTYTVNIDLGDGLEAAVSGLSTTSVSSLLQYVSINYGGDYTWRVDSVNTFGTTTGDEWTFTSIVIKTPLPDYETIGGGDGPLDGGTEGTDFRWLGTNTLFTVRRIILAAKDRVYYEDY